MGGIGKTTIGVVFNQFSQKFEGKYFMANVREESEKCGVLVHLRNQVLSKVLGENFDIGTQKIPQYIRDRLQRMKVFIVLDDVNKDKTILERYGTQRIYEVEGLNCNEVLRLFSSCAFKENHCPEDLLKHSETAVHYAKGNPLALQVLGSSFYGKSKPDWVNALNNLKRISGSDIYDDREHVMWILSDDYCSVQYAMNVLVNKSLIKISYNKLQMHDLLQEMGREIVCQEFREKPEKRSRLWDYKDVCHVLEKNKGTDAIKSIFLDLSKIEEINLDPRAFTNMSNVRLLKFYISGHFDVSKMSSKVHLQQESYRTQLSFKKVEQIWEGQKKAPKLKYVDLNHSTNLTRIPEPSETPNLERMNLRNCTGLAHIPSYVQNFNKLGNMIMAGCESLRCFPQNIHFISSIKIDCYKCVNLKEFPRISGNVVELNLMCTPIEEVPLSIECLPNLEILEMSFCYSLKRLSTSICKLKYLSSLDLSYCINLESFPEILEKMELLEEINLEEASNIKELPSSIENLEGLKQLKLTGCTKLGSLPETKNWMHPYCKHYPITRVKDYSSTSPVQLIFANCLKLNESIWADLQQRIRHMIIASRRLFCEKNIGLSDGAAVSFDFFIRYQLVIVKGPQKVKCCGVSPVYANPNTFTLEFGDRSEDFDYMDNAQRQIVGGSHEYELESIRREQFNGPQRQTSRFSQFLKNVCCFDYEPWTKTFFQDQGI
ncbi:hypothetical protein CISIN_1g005085mg [Citrus sinensis]|uniref:NB-ARC domain-containing protein n=2 Tax=Citrus TaxID=2706 RepID=A0A067DBQ9_CITSI|nr:hypothetical protein CISIN_1g005085mg [Citrus sinensis]